MPAKTSANKITRAVVRMYCMGTGDCFIIKFFTKNKECFKLMIDCGVWSGTPEHLEPYITDLKAYVKNSVDLLVITHEHTDHVSVFEKCAHMFKKNNFKVKQIWMGWSENDSLSKIKRWKTEHGEKKVALAMAAEKIETIMSNPDVKASMEKEANGFAIFGAKKLFAASLKNFADLHVDAKSGQYKGLLEGMRIVKEEIAQDNIEYLYPGDIKEDLPGLEGVKFYVLGPPEKWVEVETEGGGEGESYTHNTKLKGTDAFAAAILSAGTSMHLENILPFEKIYEQVESETQKLYESEGKKEEEKEDWRKIDNDWLFSAGSLALRINSLTNNLSLALAIEFEDSKRVMLFPGDAEYGSWSSWHRINWQGVEPEKEGMPFTQDLLRRTVFYKIAHHMSHNGTAQRLGLNMMEHKDLAAMATLDYDVISPKWKNTMPNSEMLQELLLKTKGRLMIMNEKDLFYDPNKTKPLGPKIRQAQKKMSTKEAEEFAKACVRESDNLYIDFTVKAG